MKIHTVKLVLLGTAILLVSVASYDLGSERSWIGAHLSGGAGDRGATTIAAPAVAAVHKEGLVKKRTLLTAASTGADAQSKATGSVIAKAKAPGAADSREVRLAKLSRLSKEADFKALMLKLYASGDARYVVEELQRLMGIELTEKEVASFMIEPLRLEIGVLSKLAMKHPEEALGWLAMLDGNSRLMIDVMFGTVLRAHPEILTEQVAANLPQGPGREEVLSLLRAQSDPIAEVRRVASTVTDPGALRDRLWKLADAWPAGRHAEAVQWALANLGGEALKAFLPRAAHHLSTSSPDAALALMNEITDPELLAAILNDSMHGLVQLSGRIGDVVPVIERLEGKHRASAIAELSRRWVRVDQEGLIAWINDMDAAADFEAALPLTLPQLTPQNYVKAMDTLMAQLDGTLDAALIRAAMPDLAGATQRSVDIVQRLTQLPQYGSLGAGGRGNQELLWQAVNRTAAGWVKQHGAKAAQGAQWIDGLTFNTPTDKAMVAAQLYQQWKISDPQQAGLWAARMGVKVN